MTVSDLLVLLAKHRPDATVYAKDPVTGDPVPVVGLEHHNTSVVLTVEAG